MRTDLRQLPLFEVRILRVELASDGEPEDAVPEEFEALIGQRPIRRPGRVREDLLQALGRELGDQALKAGVTGAT
jgi:hypothetical protein